ncbi:MAG: sigma-70 family RNA polymerase sigma factor [Verrucomicrobia bacterium]|nr:sigma-70 family RNA polymerase sigma factor [Verrucomicrobiota bacterium]
MEAGGDVELLERCLGGDREAFGHLVTRHQSLVCSLAYSACGDLARSEDLAQEIFLTAWRNLGQLRDRARFRSWLCGIARNLINNSLRRELRDATRLAAPLETVAEPTSPRPNPRDQAITREEEALLWRTLSELPETYREPLILFYREQQSVDQVATALDLSQDAVKQRLSRGRALLREQMASFVETTLRNTRPGKAFTLAVLVSLPAIGPQATAAGLAMEAAKGSAAAKSAGATLASGAVLGPLIGLLGAYIGVKASIENTRSPRERQFMKRQSGWAFALVFAMFVAMTLVMTVGKRLLPAHPGGFAALIIGLVLAYLVGLFAFILRSNRRQRQIQIEDGTYVSPEAVLANLRRVSPAQARRGMYATLGGSIVGSVAFAVVLAAQHHDWVAAALVVTMALSVFGSAAGLCSKGPERFPWLSLLAPLVALGLSLLTVDLRWASWMINSPINPTARRWTLIGLNTSIAALAALIAVGVLLNQRLHRKTPARTSGTDQSGVDFGRR